MSSSSALKYPAIIAGLALVVIVAIVLRDQEAFLSSEFDPRALVAQEVDHRIHVPCDLRAGPCKVRVGDMAFDLSLEPGVAPPLTPLNVSISSANQSINLAQWYLWFQGKEMDMGVHWLQAKAPTNGEALTFSGMIPVCTVDQDMVWQLVAHTRLNDQDYRLFFEFVSEH